jgi:DNA polymerase I
MIHYITSGIRLFEDEEEGRIKMYDETGMDTVIAMLEKEPILGLDTETTGFDVHTCSLLLIQLGTKDFQVVFDAKLIHDKRLRNLLESDKLFLLFNAKFDLRFFMKEGIHIKRVYDVFLAEAILTTGYDFDEQDLSLKAVTLKYLNKERDKTIRGKINYLGSVPVVIEYAADDVVDLEDIMNLQLPEIDKWGLRKVLDLENEVVHVFAHMELVGVHVDADKWKDVVATISESKKTVLEELDNIVLTDPKLKDIYKPKYVQGDLFGFVERELKINWNSTQQKLKILQQVGIAITDTSEQTISKHKYKHKIVGKLLEYSRLQKYESSFGIKFLSFINPVTHRIHFNIWQILNSGRVSYSMPNVAQIPGRTPLGKRMRKAFTAEPGYKISGGDFAQYELRIIANYSEDPVWIGAFKRGDDLHSVICSKVFNIPIEDVKKPSHFKADIAYRDIAKSVAFGLSYGMSEYKLANTLEISVSDAKAIIDQFFKAVPKVKDFLDSLGNTGKMRGYIKTAKPYSRIRWFPNWKKAMENPHDKDSFKIFGEIERQSKNAPIQGTNADLIKSVLCELYRIKLSDNKWSNVRFILVIYDEIRCEVPEDIAKEWRTIMNKVMVDVSESVLTKVPIVADCTVTDSWEK